MIMELIKLIPTMNLKWLPTKKRRQLLNTLGQSIIVANLIVYWGLIVAMCFGGSKKPFLRHLNLFWPLLGHTLEL